MSDKAIVIYDEQQHQELLARIHAQDAELARLRNDLAIIEQGCNSPWMTGAAFKDRVADIFASRALLDGADTPGEGGA